MSLPLEELDISSSKLGLANLSGEGSFSFSAGFQIGFVVSSSFCKFWGVGFTYGYKVLVSTNSANEIGEESLRDFSTRNLMRNLALLFGFP